MLFRPELCQVLRDEGGKATGCKGGSTPFEQAVEPGRAELHVIGREALHRGQQAEEAGVLVLVTRFLLLLEVLQAC